MKAVYVLLALAGLWAGYQFLAGGPDGPFEPNRDAAQDVRQATAEAGRTGRRILLDVGNNGCVWCARMHEFLAADERLRGFLEQNYVTVKVNMSPSNPNVELLRRYPAVPGTPHLFVLEKDGTFLHSQETDSLEAGSSYDAEKFLAFLKAWAPPRAG